MDNNSIQDYWNDRAAASGGSATATTDDIHLRELEISTIVRTLKSLDLPDSPTFLDAGCGDGYSTLRVVRELPALTALGVDYASQMVANARQRLKEQTADSSRVTFAQGDIRALDAVIGFETFDVVLTDRCLINLVSPGDQARAFEQIAKHLTPGGTFLAIENFVEGHAGMNTARETVGLPPIPIRWHNRYFSQPEFESIAKPYFRFVTLEDFASSYYFATRVVYAAMCKMRGEDLNYNHEIHQLAVRLPPTGQFSPIRLAIMKL
jgi:ubiquinone/menaquinone biosynthesis C-methylase UbiE